MATGYEQARSVVAALAGDMRAADDLQLELPETGVCSTDSRGRTQPLPAQLVVAAVRPSRIRRREQHWRQHSVRSGARQRPTRRLA